MENLPADIFIYHLFPLLCNKSINLGLACKRLYRLYVKRRDSDRRIAKRFERVKSKFDECCANGSGVGVTFDRMYKLQPYRESRYLLIFAKSYQPRHLELSDVDLFLHYTLDRWKTVERKEFRFVDSTMRGLLSEITWVVCFNAYSVKFEDIWFAIELICEGINLHLWDNNNGWNYDVSGKHHWIPEFSVIERYPLMDFEHGGYLPYGYSALKAWLNN